MPFTLKYRHNMPETNSSSTHTLAIGNPRQMQRTKTAVYCGEFLWGEELLNTPNEIIEYILAYLQGQYRRDIDNINGDLSPEEFIERVSEIVPEYDTLLSTALELGIEVTEVVPLTEWGGQYSLGVIDHESTDVFGKLVDRRGFAEAVREMLIGGVILVSNDNMDSRYRRDYNNNLYSPNDEWLGKIAADIYT